ncbi:DUF4862 family protein [Arthrobacter pigmenti]
MYSNSSGEPVSWLVGAYSASPTKDGWDAGAEGRYLDAVTALPGVTGLEVPLTETLHKFDEDWFLKRLRPDLNIVITMLSGTLARLRSSPQFGLASIDNAGRQLAIEDARRAASAVQRVNLALGAPVVVAVEFHSAPVAGEGRSSGEALLRSLVELGTWDWGGARLVIEHCDAKVENRMAAKGMLPLEAELEAVLEANNRTGASIGTAINWGRSVIEQRSAGAAVEHLQQARNAGVLSGLVFSGCADVPTRFGGPWADVHVPPAPAGSPGNKTEGYGTARVGDSHFLEPASLLTVGRIREAVEAAGPELDFRAVKIAAPPNSKVEERIAAVTQSVRLVREAALGVAV